MKHLLLVLLLACFSSAFADTPAKIAEDYRKQTAAALMKVNETLEKATVPLVAALVKAGDTKSAETLREQMKAKIEGEPVAAPQSSAIALFKSYDAARIKALEPAQKAAISRIESMLASSEGKKMEVVAELGKVRAEVAAGSVTPSTTDLPAEWSFRRTPTAGTDGVFTMNPDGTARMQGGGGNVGQWKRSKKGDSFTVEWENPKDTWTVILGESKDLCEVHSTVWKDTRYIKAIVPAE